MLLFSQERLLGAPVAVSPPSDIGALFAQHGPAVFRRANRLLGNEADAQEAVQEIFIRVVKGVERFDRRAAVTTWLYQITTNYCLNKLRDGQRRRELVEQEGTPTEQADARAESLSLMRQLLREADPREAEAAVFVFIDGMSHDEAAEVLGVSRRTVGNLVERFSTWARERMAS